MLAASEPGAEKLRGSRRSKSLSEADDRRPSVTNRRLSDMSADRPPSPDLAATAAKANAEDRPGEWASTGGGPGKGHHAKKVKRKRRRTLGSRFDSFGLLPDPATVANWKKHNELRLRTGPNKPQGPQEMIYTKASVQTNLSSIARRLLGDPPEEAYAQVPTAVDSAKPVIEKLTYGERLQVGARVA